MTAAAIALQRGFGPCGGRGNAAGGNLFEHGFGRPFDLRIVEVEQLSQHTDRARADFQLRRPSSFAERFHGRCAGAKQALAGIFARPVLVAIELLDPTADLLGACTISLSCRFALEVILRLGRLIRLVGGIVLLGCSRRRRRGRFGGRVGSNGNGPENRNC